MTITDYDLAHAFTNDRYWPILLKNSIFRRSEYLNSLLARFIVTIQGDSISITIYILNETGALIHRF